METEERICRVCLQAEIGTYARIFSKNNDIAYKINIISGIQIIEFQDNPALICQTCLKELYRCIQFRNKCLSSDDYFKTQMSNIEEIFLTSSKQEIFIPPLNNELLQLQSGDFVIKFEKEEEPTIVEFPVETTKPGWKRPPAQKLHKSVNPSQCRFCGLVLSRRNRRIQHERLHTIQKTQNYYKCFFCTKQFNQKVGLLPHFKQVHQLETGRKENWKCAICPSKVVPACKMAFHYEHFHREFSTSIPGMDVKPMLSEIVEPSERKSRPNLKPKKIRTKTVKPPVTFWPCSICGNNFTNYQRYQKHLRQAHELEDNQLIQDNAVPLSIGTTLVSSKAAGDRTKYPCSTCGKSFASAMTVKNHEKIHLDQKFTCDLCGSFFKVKSYLTSHVQKVHIKLKKFKCSIESCSAEFVHRELLNYHVRKHLNIRNFACQYCGKTFVTSKCCRIHERIHTDERPYACKYCDRRFIHHSDHRRHQLKHAEARQK